MKEIFKLREVSLTFTAILLLLIRQKGRTYYLDTWICVLL